MKCPHCGKEISPRKKGHVCTQFEEDRGMDGAGECLRRICKTCGQEQHRDSIYKLGGDYRWRKGRDPLPGRIFVAGAGGEGTMNKGEER